VGLTACASAARDSSVTIQRSPLQLRETYVTAEKVYRRAELYFDQKEFPDAIFTSKSGLSLVGDSYYTPAIIDDTDTRLVLAQHEEEQGNLERAASYLQTVLRNRLALLHERIE
jgi:hypothetical protein